MCAQFPVKILAVGALANERDVDLLFSDIMMPDAMNGLDLAREIHRRRPELPVLLTSGYADTAMLHRSPDGTSILRKPYDIAGLQAAIRDALGRCYDRQLT